MQTRGLIFAAVSLCSVLAGLAPGETQTDWFPDAKFGMFIHFGVSSQGRLQKDKMTAGENYEAGAREFNPVLFDAKEWVRVAKEGGAKYIVFTSKHHDGFCNWDSALTDWDIMEQTVFKRDIIAELSEACKAEGIKLGLYYSIADWHHPEYDVDYSNRNGFHYFPNPEADISKYMTYMYGQIRELCEKYDPSLFWFDGSRGFRPPERKRLLGQQDMVDLLHLYGAISNSRLGDDDELKFVDYLSTGDNMIPAGFIGVQFEAAGTMNESWHFKAHDEDWKSVGELLARLVDIVGKGGNYLLNVGPTGQGVIPEASVARLKAMGDWLDVNGEAIYGAEAGPYPHTWGWGSVTQKKTGEETALYLNVIEWPKNGVLKLYGLNNAVLEASLLATGEPLETEALYNAAAGLNMVSVNVPEAAPDPYVSVIKLTVAGHVSMDQALRQQSDGVVMLDGFQAAIHDAAFVPNKPNRPIDFRQFTVMKSREGIVPAVGMTVGGFNTAGDALSWDFRLVEPGIYEIGVVCSVRHGQELKADGLLRATVAGQAVESALVECSRSKNMRMSDKFRDALCILGTVKIDSLGMQTLSLEVIEDFAASKLSIRAVKLLPTASEQ